jgi:hypothetical protein
LGGVVAHAGSVSGGRLNQHWLVESGGKPFVLRGYA